VRHPRVRRLARERADSSVAVNLAARALGPAGPSVRTFHTGDGPASVPAMRAT
jgi:hypothetical protein